MTSQSSTNTSSHFIVLGSAILIMSSSGTLGRSIDLPVFATIWIRCIIGSIALYSFIRLSGNSIRLQPGQSTRLIIWSSVLMGLHWVSYFYALQKSTVAIGMLSLFTYPLFTALLEPLLLHTPFRTRHIPLSLLAFFGLFMLIPEFDLKNDHTLGILIGILSSIGYSLRNILVKKGVTSSSGTNLMFYQLVIITILLSPLLLLPANQFSIRSLADDSYELLALGLITTAMGHTLFVRSFTHFSATTVSILSNLTPLFGIGLGFLLLDEVPKQNVMLGGFLILLTAVIEGFASMRKA